MTIEKYISYISQDGKWGGELEKYAEQNIYKINIIDYRIINSGNSTTFHDYVWNLNKDNNYNKDLCILTYVHNNHYNLLFDISH